jgi:hypothetical protein
MKTITIREAREGLSHPEQLFADRRRSHRYPAWRAGGAHPAAQHRVRALRDSLKDFLASPADADRARARRLLAEEREDRG